MTQMDARIYDGSTGIKISDKQSRLGELLFFAESEVEYGVPLKTERFVVFYVSKNVNIFCVSSFLL